MNHIIFIHGRGFKPTGEVLEGLWERAICSGLKRDFDKESVDAFRKARKTFAYYGDLSNKLLLKETEEQLDLANQAEFREKTLYELERLDRQDFFDKSKYDQIKRKRGQAATIVAKYMSKILRIFGKQDEAASIIAKRKKDLADYWDSGDYGVEVRKRMTKSLETAMESKARVLILSHSLGTIVTYDCLWTLAHDSKNTAEGRGKVHTWVTLGSPLGDESVKSQLFGFRREGPKKYPSNIRTWINISARHDYIAADQGVCDDFLGLMGHHGTDIIDREIINLAQRGDESHPHSSLGYLIHPTVSATIHQWLWSGDRPD